MNKTPSVMTLSNNDTRGVKQRVKILELDLVVSLATLQNTTQCLASPLRLGLVLYQVSTTNPAN